MIRNSCFLLVICFVLIIFTAQAQVRVAGKVVDSKTKHPVPFATIGIKNKDIGTVSDENGRFNFDISKDSVGNDANLIVSSVGYKDTLVSVLDFNKGFLEIRLSPNTILLNEITINPVRFKTKIFGRTGRSAFMSTRMISERNHVNDELGKEIGTILEIDKDCLLRDFNMFVIFNHFKSIKFRLNIYSIKDGLPDSLLINDNITFDVKKGRQMWTNVDLTKYNIRLEGRNKVAVVIQWLKSELSDDDLKRSFNVAAVHSGSNFIFFRDKSQSKWLKVGGNMTFNVTADSFKM